MTARDEAERAPLHWTTERGERATPMSVEPTTLHRTRRHFPTRPPRWFIAAVIAIGGMQLMVVMDGTIALVAIPKIQNELGLSDAGRSWVISAYMLTFGGLMLLGGRLGDTFGRKRTFIVGVALFTIASVMCGIAWNEGTLVGARLLHGAAAAIIAPTRLALMATTFPKGPARNSATAVFGVMSSVSTVLSLVVGAALTAVSWRLAFLVNVPIGLLVLTWPAPCRNPAGADETRRHRGCACHIGLDRFGFRVLDGAAEGLDIGHHDRFGSGGAGRFRRVRRGRAHRGEPRRAVQPVFSIAIGWPRSRPSSWPVACYLL